MKIKSIKSWQESKQEGYTILTECNKVFVADPVSPSGYMMNGAKFENFSDCEQYIEYLEG